MGGRDCSIFHFHLTPSFLKRAGEATPNFCRATDSQFYLLTTRQRVQLYISKHFLLHRFTKSPFNSANYCSLSCSICLLKIYHCDIRERDVTLDKAAGDEKSVNTSRDPSFPELSPSTSFPFMLSCPLVLSPGRRTSQSRLFAVQSDHKRTAMQQAMKSFRGIVGTIVYVTTLWALQTYAICLETD
jgi:hypothetical protein